MSTPIESWKTDGGKDTPQRRNIPIYRFFYHFFGRTVGLPETNGKTCHRVSDGGITPLRVSDGAPETKLHEHLLRH